MYFDVILSNLHQLCFLIRLLESTYHRIGYYFFEGNLECRDILMGTGIVMRIRSFESYCSLCLLRLEEFYKMLSSTRMVYYPYSNNKIINWTLNMAFHHKRDLSLPHRTHFRDTIEEGRKSQLVNSPLSSRV